MGQSRIAAVPNGGGSWDVSANRECTMILAIDPGPEQSAFVQWNGKRIIDFGKVENHILLDNLRDAPCEGYVLVIEKIASYGMAVGAEVFETVFWSGRFAEAFAGTVHRIPRLDVKLQMCRDSRAKDANIRQALIDRFGGKEKAIGTKTAPGPLRGVSGDVWAALAVAVTWWETRHVRSVEAEL